jgi:hypothetical protein
VQAAVDALHKWNRCFEWKRDGNAFVPGLHRWIKARQWENLPEGDRTDPLARYRTTPQPISSPGPAATPAEIAEIIGSLKRPKP